MVTVLILGFAPDARECADADPDADSDAEGDALGSGLDDAFVDPDHAGGEVFEVEIGVIAALRERFGQVALEVRPLDPEASGEERL